MTAWWTLSPRYASASPSSLSFRRPPSDRRLQRGHDRTLSPSLTTLLNNPGQRAIPPDRTRSGVPQVARVYRCLDVRILVVDDERAVREALDRALRLEGFEVALAPDGERALQVLGDARPDAIVLDVLMPGLDGLEVCQVRRRMGERTP